MNSDDCLARNAPSSAIEGRGNEVSLKRSPTNVPSATLGPAVETDPEAECGVCPHYTD
jgi:hypothetical protein